MIVNSPAPHSPPNPMSNTPSKFQLYVRICFGLLVVFMIIGNFAGHRQASAMGFIVISVVWCLTRIMVEAFDAFTTLNGGSPKPPVDSSYQDSKTQTS